MSRGCGCCDDRRSNRRDFRQSKGDGPEVPPHRKKSKKGPTIRADHKHIYETNGPRVETYWHGGAYAVIVYECLECGKRGDTKYIWNYTA